MRKNTQDAIRRFFAGQASPNGKRGSSVWTDGETIFSYGTAIARRVSENQATFNVTQYSSTTSCHQSAIRAELSYAFPTVLEVDRINHGASTL